MRPTLITASLAMIVSGCTTLATHGAMDQASSEALGEFHAFAQICNEVGAYGDDIMQLHQGVVEDFLDLSTYDKEALSGAQNRVYEIYRTPAEGPLRARWGMNAEQGAALHVCEK